MNERTVLEKIMNKPKKGEGKADNKNAVAALMSLRKSDDEKQLAKYLVGMHFSVCQNFFLEYCREATGEEINNLINALMEDADMNTKNPALFLFPKGFSAVCSLTKNKKYAPALIAMNKILAKAESKKGFATSSRTVFNKIFTDPTDTAGLVQLYSKLESGKLKSTKEEKDRLARFLEFVQVLDHEKAKTHEILSDLPTEEASIRFVEQLNEVGFGVLRNIEKMQMDSVEMVKKLTADNESRAAQNSENTELRKKVDDLTERLRVSLKMSDVSSSQELANLKSELSKAVMLDYADYEKSKDKGHSKDLFKVYRAMLARIFKQLKRLDIPLT